MQEAKTKDAPTEGQCCAVPQPEASATEAFSCCGASPQDSAVTTATEIRETIKERYGATAKGEGAAAAAGSCCGGPSRADVLGKSIGYTDEDLASVPEGANLGLGCGNPTALATIREGDTVLDLGSGAGFDCFLAANKVGKTGRVIGVDMTPEMIAKATENALKSDYDNVEFRLGEIENLPVEDDSVDLITSNCVINLSTDKGKTFREAHRVLKPGGCATISDIVLLKELPEAVRQSANAYAACVGGALLKDDYIQAIKDAGFETVEITQETAIPQELFANSVDPISQEIAKEGTMTKDDVQGVIASIQSIKVLATKAAQ